MSTVNPACFRRCQCPMQIHFYGPSPVGVGRSVGRSVARLRHGVGLHERIVCESILMQKGDAGRNWERGTRLEFLPRNKLDFSHGCFIILGGKWSTSQTRLGWRIIFKNPTHITSNSERNTVIKILKKSSCGAAFPDTDE